MANEVRNLFEPVHAATLAQARTAKQVQLKMDIAAFCPSAAEQQGMLSGFTESLHRRYGDEATEAVLYFSLTQKALGRLSNGQQTQSPGDEETTQTTGNSVVEYHIKGARFAVMAKIDALFDRYHPHGYGTMVHSILMDGSDGLYVARVSRSNSCD